LVTLPLEDAAYVDEEAISPSFRAVMKVFLVVSDLSDVTSFGGGSVSDDLIREIAVLGICPFPDFFFHSQHWPHVKFHTCHVGHQFKFPRVRSQTDHVSKQSLWTPRHAVEGLVARLVVVEETDYRRLG
jgi:hypothetical protein